MSLRRDRDVVVTPSEPLKDSADAVETWAGPAVEEACEGAGRWFRSLTPFPHRVNLGSVVGFRHPAVVSEMDCVVNFSRILAEGGTPWSAMHHEVSVSRWLFDSPHAGAAAGDPRWRVDLALMREDELLEAELPAKNPGFAFDAFLEFAYLTDSWRQPKAARWGQPGKGRKKVEADVAKIGRYVKSGVCRVGYAIVFTETDFEFESDFVERAEVEHGCRVRFIESCLAPRPSHVDDDSFHMNLFKLIGATGHEVAEDWANSEPEIFTRIRFPWNKSPKDVWSPGRVIAYAVGSASVFAVQEVDGPPTINQRRGPAGSDGDRWPHEIQVRTLFYCSPLSTAPKLREFAPEFAAKYGKRFWNGSHWPITDDEFDFLSAAVVKAGRAFD